MATFVHFDLPADEPERAKKFYEELFGWKIDKLPSAPGVPEYYFIETSENGKKGLAGGMGKRGAPEQKITNYIGVANADEFAEKVEKAGGKIAQPKMAVPGWGYIVICLDTEGNTFGLWQDDKSAK